jgi:hypothetical protein
VIDDSISQGRQRVREVVEDANIGFRSSLKLNEQRIGEIMKKGLEVDDHLGKVYEETKPNQKALESYMVMHQEESSIMKDNFDVVKEIVL